MATEIDEGQMSFMNELLGEVTTDDAANTEDSQEDLQTTETTDEIVGEETKADGGEETKIDDGTGSDEETDEIDETQETISNLRAQILALSEALGTDPKVQKVKEDVSDKTEDVKKSDEVQTKLESFLSEDELDRLIDEPALINVAFQRAQSSLMSSIQANVQAEVNRQILVSRAVSDFYSTNEDLLPYSKFVQFVMAEVESTNKDKTYAEIFKTTADECRKRLGLAKTPVRTRESSKANQKPAFVGSKRGSNRPAGKPDFFDNNAADMF